MKIWRIVAGFVLAPLVAPLVFFIAEGIRHRFPVLLGPPAIPYGRVIYVGFIIPLACAAALVLGVPALILFRKRGWHKASGFGLAGALIGFVVGLGLCLNGLIGEGYTFFLLACVVAGGLSAVAFRWVAGERA